MLHILLNFFMNYNIMCKIYFYTISRSKKIKIIMDLNYKRHYMFSFFYFLFMNIKNLSLNSYITLSYKGLLLSFKSFVFFSTSFFKS